MADDITSPDDLRASIDGKSDDEINAGVAERGTEKVLGQPGRDAGVASEVGGVQTEEIRYSVSLHPRHQPGIVHLNSRDMVLDNDPPPFPVDCLAVWQQAHTGFDCAYFALGFGDSQPETVTANGPCHRVPKFRNVLMCVIESGALPRQSGEGGVHSSMLRIGPSRNAQEDVRVH